MRAPANGKLARHVIVIAGASGSGKNTVDPEIVPTTSRLVHLKSPEATGLRSKSTP